MTNRRELADRLEGCITASGGIDLRDPEILREAARLLREPVAGCGCDEVEMGSYDAQVELVPPPHMVRDDGRGICVDACLALEVSSLWRAGITTTGCCCGHNIAPAYIGVVEADIPRMKAMGYEVVPNAVRPGAQDSFKPLRARYDEELKGG